MPDASTPASTTQSRPVRVQSAAMETGKPVLEGAVSKAASRKISTMSGVVRIAMFFVLIGLLALGLDTAVDHGLRGITVSKFGSLNKIISGRVNAEVVINGSSRALCHYDPRVIQQRTGLASYNIGMNASQTDFQLAMLKTYLKNNTKPRVVIQNLDMFSFQITEKGSLYDPGYYMPYLDQRELYDFFKSIESHAWKWKYIPLYGYAVEDMRFTWVWGLLGLAGYQGVEDYYLGFNPRPGTWTDEFDRFKAAHKTGVNHPINSKGVQALEDIVKLCQENGIQIILCYSPTYYEMQELELNGLEIRGMFKELAQRRGVEFWDYSDSNISRRKEFFNNSQHLNATGAEVFSLSVAERLSQHFAKN
jgi:hypothetical protein